MDPSENIIPKPTSISFQELLQKAKDGNLLINGCSAALENRLFHCLQVPQMHPYDLNSTPETILGFEPVTPDKSTRSDNSNIDDTAHMQIEKQSTTTLENQNLATVESQGTDLSTTPKQKQRRKKHRPKVVTERKPRAPKPTVTTPAATEDPPRKKRKYVRKNPNEKKASETPTEVKRSPKKRPCKRALNFNEMDSEDEYSASMSSEQSGRRSCTRGVSKVMVQLCQQIGEITAQNELCSTSPEGSHISSNLNLTELNEFKGNYSHAVQQLNFGVNVHRVHYDSVQAYQLISWQNNRKKRSEKGSKNMVGSRDEQNNARIVIDISPCERPTKKRSRSSTKARDLASLTRIAEQAMANSYTAEQPESCVDALKAQIMTTLATKKRTKKINLPAVQYSGFQQLFPISGVLQEVGSTQMLNVDDIERQLKSLDINRESSEIPHPPTNEIVPFFTRYKELNTLVLYKGGGEVVPFSPKKKSRPRPKVDLDEETTRVWKLLLENINSEGIDGTDEAKAKWWQEERQVFHGRAESFIARMHLVQGDRRFSKWKGSVLDSVVGVFLTQNVSDHLSSSAFMYLASRYPLKSRNPNKECVVSNETEELISDEDAPNQPLCGSHSTPCVGEENEIAGPERIEASRSNTEQEENAMIGVISLQTFSDFSTPQTISKTGSCSESNSDEDDMAKEFKAVSLEEPTPLLENQHVEMPDITLSDDFIESKAMENEEYSENMDKSGPESSKESSMEPSSSLCSCKTVSVEVSVFESFEILREEAHSSEISQSTITLETLQTTAPLREPQGELCKNTITSDSESRLVENLKSVEITAREEQNLPNHPEEIRVVVNDTLKSEPATSKAKSGRVRREKNDDRDWDQLRKQAEANCRRQRAENTVDSLDWEAIRCADVDEVADTIKERGMNNKLAQRIKDFLDRLVKDHGSMDLEWLRDVPPDQAKEYLLSIRGLGLKSVECVRLLTLHHLAFPVDTNVGRIAVRLGWVPLQPLPESLQLHLLELYPVLETIQKYLWPRLCKLDQRTLYELHYQMITFGKVFCTKNKPNCNACPMRGECRHFASAFASARLALPGPEEKSITVATESSRKEDINQPGMNERPPLLQLPAATKQKDEDMYLVKSSQSEGAVAGPSCCVPIIEEPLTPELGSGTGDIEDFFPEDPEEIPTIKLNIEEFTQTLQNYMQNNMELRDGDMSKALVAINPDAASIPMPKLKNVDRLRTEHHVYELPDSHPLLERLEMEKRETDDPSPYLLAIWTPGETPNSITPPENRCSSHALGKLCNDEECFSCNSIRESDSQTVRGTLLIPCRTAMRGSFPLNGTYFQVNEVFADHDSSLNPIDVPRAWLWNLNRRTVYFGTSIPTIFRGLTTQGIQHCFWRGYVCVRGFDQKSRAPRPLMARLHAPASKGKRIRDPKTDE